MKVLENLRRTMESINATKSRKTEDCAGEYAEIFEKYKDIPKETLMGIIADVKAKDTPAQAAENNDDVTDDELIVENADNTTDVKPSAGKPVEEPHKTQVNELDASETDDTPEDFYTEEGEDVTDDELIISEEDEPSEDTEVPDEQEEVTEDDEDSDFDDYQDELDIVEEDAEEIDTNIPEEENGTDAADTAQNQKVENAEKIDLNIPSEENSDDAADTAAKQITNEANTAAKAAMANKEFKGSFSSDVDALTNYLNEL